MNPIVRNVIAVVAGFVAGSLVNLALITVGGAVIPPPAGVDTSTMDGLRAAMPLFEPRHFITPFVAHALGTLVGAFIAVKIAVTRKCAMATVVGVLFLGGGIAAAVMIPAPLWFEAVDIVFAYLPMAWLGWKLAKNG